MREFAVAENGRGAKLLHSDLLQDFASGSERFDEHGLLIGDVLRNEVQVFQRQSQVFGECAVMSRDAEHGPPRAMRFQSAAAEIANSPVTVG